MAANAYYAVKYLQDRYKMAPHQAAALVGTWQQESGMNLNTGARNKGDGRDGTDSVGIAQWNGDRARGLHNFAVNRQSDWTNLDTQIDYAVHELTKGAEKQWGDRLFAAPDIQSAARAAISYERPEGWSAQNPSGGHGWDNRFANAQRLLGASPEEIAQARATSAPMPQGSAPQGLLAMGGGSALAMPQVASALLGTQVASNDASFMPNPAQQAIANAMQPNKPADPFAGAASDTDPFTGLAEDYVEPAAPAQPTAAPVSQQAADPFEGLAEDATPATPIMANPEAQPAKPEVDADGEAPWDVRYKVGLLDQPEDRLAALQHIYPYAKPYGEDNFVYTDPSTGKITKYNQEGWMPSLGDVASIVPELGETLGGALGAAGAALAGAGTGGAGWVTIPAAAGAGATAGRETVQGIGNWLTGNQDTRSTPERLVGQATTFAGNAAGEVLGMGAGRALSNAADTIVRPMLGGGTPGVKQAYQEATQLGMKPTAGEVVPRLAGVQQAIAGIPLGGAGALADRVGENADLLARNSDRIVADIAGANGRGTTQSLGEALQSAAKTSKAAIRADEDARYSELFNLMGTNKVPAVNTASLAADLTQQKAGMGAFDADDVGSYIDDAIKRTSAMGKDIANGVDFQYLKSKRTRIGQLAEKTDDPAQRLYYDSMYSALTQDMEAAVKAAGPDAEAAWTRANTNAEQLRNPKLPDSLPRTVNPVINADTPEKAYRVAVDLSEMGATKLAAMRKRINDPAVWNSVTATALETMGKGKDSVEGGVAEFNPTKFIREWRAMPPETKDVLFRGTELQQYKQDLDLIARVGQRFKGYAKEANHSNTAKHLAINALFGAAGATLGAYQQGNMVGTAAGAAAGLATRAGTARLLLNPTFVRWLADAPKQQMAREGLAKHVDDLRGLVANSSDAAFRASVTDYLRDLTGE